MTLQEEYRAQRERLATGYGFGDFIDMFAAPMEPPVFLSVRVRMEQAFHQLELRYRSTHPDITPEEIEAILMDAFADINQSLQQAHYFKQHTKV